MIQRDTILRYKEIARQIRMAVLRMHFTSQTSHLGSSLSIIDILVVLYFHTMKCNPKRPLDPFRDRFILSKGHACSALYGTLAKKKYFSEQILNKYCTNNGILPGHATLHSVPGIEASTGSLGHGLPIGAGMALAGKNDCLPYKVYALLSDGECNEGSIWEAALFASMHRLDNLVVIIDYNKFQACGKTKEILDLEPFLDKWKSFGWKTYEIDGHNISKLCRTFNKIKLNKKKPVAILAHTVKGKGISYMENSLKWHYRAPNKDELEQALIELNTNS